VLEGEDPTARQENRCLQALKNELLLHLKTYNLYYEGQNLQLRHREEEDEFIVEGLLNISWGLRRPIRLQMQDDNERIRPPPSSSSWHSGCNLGAQGTHTSLEAEQAAHGFCSLVSSILGLMKWMLVLLQMLEKNIFSLQSSPGSTHRLAWELGQPHGMLGVAHLHPSSPDVCQTILKPLTVPNVQISEVDAPPEGDQMPSPTDSRGLKPLQEDTPQLMRTRSDVGVRRRGNVRTPSDQRRIRRHRFSINGHFYNHKLVYGLAFPGAQGCFRSRDASLSPGGVSAPPILPELADPSFPPALFKSYPWREVHAGPFYRQTSVFTPAYGSVTNVRINSTMTTPQVLKLLLNKFKASSLCWLATDRIENSAEEFALYVVHTSGEKQKLKTTDYPLIARILQGPCEQVSKVFLMEKDQVEEVTYDVAQYIKFEMPVLKSFIQKLQEEEDREVKKLMRKACAELVHGPASLGFLREGCPLTNLDFKYTVLRLMIRQRLEEIAETPATI
ncbi:Ras association domain-containing protein 2, partial [Saguinus oedipus]